MKQLIYPFATFSLLVAVYVSKSGVPLKVHVLNIGALALGYLLPSIVSPFMPSTKCRIYMSAAFALIAMLTWDGISHLVIVKAESFSILLYAPWTYVFGLVILVSMCLGTSWLSMRLTKR